MKKNHNSIIFFCLSISMSICTEPLSHLATGNKKSTSKKKKLITVNWENEDLVTIINYLAAEKQVNIILPMPPATIPNKITFKLPHKVPIDYAFAVLNTLLEASGYSMIDQHNQYIIVKTDQSLKEVLPIYIGTAPESLPDTDERIRYVYYFDNLKIGQNPDLKTVLENILQEHSTVILEPNTNCMIITARSHGIKVAMQLIGELDKTGFREVIEIIKLTNTSSPFVAQFLNEKLLAPLSKAMPLSPTDTSGAFFERTTKVIADDRTNSLIILGKSQAVDRLKDFIYTHIDKPLESGDSIIHTYSLKYLEAQTFVEDLKKIIQPRTDSDQAKAAAAGIEGRMFANVIIEAERPKTADQLQVESSKGTAGTAVIGGNRLIIAAKKDEWRYLKSLIDDLDKPQPQVSLDVLIVDVSLDKVKALASQVRNKVNAFPQGVASQAAQMDAPVLNDPPTTLLTNLLLLKDGRNLANEADAGSFILSFNDPVNSGIWLVMQFLNEFTTTKILSHPHVIVLNHQQAALSIGETRVLPADAKQNPDGTLIVTNANISASLKVNILPKINLSNTINLQISVDIENFISAFQNAEAPPRNTRTVITNATVGNGEVLVLGGLIKNNDQDRITQTPLLAKIPLIGWLFKNRLRDTAKDNLMIFISPTVIKPKLGGGMTQTAASKFNYSKQLVNSGELFDQVRDPVSRWFFKLPEGTTKDTVRDYGEVRMFSKEPIPGGQLVEKNTKKIKVEDNQDEKLKALLADNSSPFIQKKPA